MTGWTTEWTGALAWAVSSGAAEADVLAAWRTGRAAEIPTGRLWDVVRITRTLGLLTLVRLPADVHLGPVLEVPSRGVVEVVVPAGTTTSWPRLYGTVCVGRGGSIRCPAPHLTRLAGHRTVCGRRWLIPPAALVPATDADALVEAVAAASARCGLDWLAAVHIPALVEWGVGSHP